MNATLATTLVLVFAGVPARAHRLDEYLQGTLISVERNRIQAQITLTPGVAVFPIVRASIDTDRDGVITGREQRAYAERVLRDLSLRIDGHAVTPHLLSIQFPGIEEMQDGRGEIRLEFSADLPAGGPNRRLVFENRHQSRISAYQVNCLVPQDPAIRIVAQNRDYLQSRYQLDYLQDGVRSEAMAIAWRADDGGRLGALALLLAAAAALVWRKRATSSRRRT